MRLLMLSLVLGGLVMAGCTKSLNYYNQNDEETRYCDPEFENVDMASRGLAIGGVVMRMGLLLDDRCGVDIPPEDLDLMVQAELWTPRFEAIVRTRVPYDGVYSWRAVVSEVPLDLRLETSDIFSSRGRLKPDLLAEWSAYLDYPRYLALVRIENTWSDNTGKHGWMAASGLGRVVVLILEVYDLERGVSVWSHMTQRHVFPGEKANELDESGNYQIRQYGSFDAALDDAMRHAVAKLPLAKTSGPATNSTGDDELDF